MICDHCRETGKRSTVSSDGAYVTLIAAREYWDEDGARHFHDSNWQTQTFRCSNGHQWTERKQQRCPAEGCDYGSSAGAQ